MKEVKIGGKGRITIPHEIRKALGVKEGDVLTVDVSGDAILLRLKGFSVKESKGVAKIEKVELGEVEEAPGRET